MDFSWKTLGKDDPLICGSPAQFGDVANTFTRIADQCGYLGDELGTIRFGQNEGFTGQASSAFHVAIGECAEALHAVPSVSLNISDIFSDHQRNLEALHQAAESALARARTNWNRKLETESDIGTHGQSLRAIAQQISALEGIPTASAGLQQLRSRQAHVAGLLDDARSGLRTANDLVQDSAREWDTLRNQEEDLNEHTSGRLGAVELWALKDPWHEHFQRTWQTLTVVWEAISELVVDLAAALYTVLNYILDVLDFVGIFLEFIPIIGQIYKLVEIGLVLLKVSAGLVLLLSDRIDFSEFALDTAISMAGFLVPGGRQFAKAGAKLMKRAGPHIKRAARQVDDMASGAADTLRDVGEGFNDILGQLGARARTKIHGLADSTERMMERRATLHSGPARPFIAKSGDVMSGTLRGVGDRVEDVFDIGGDMIEADMKATARGIEIGGTGFRKSADNVVDILNSQLPDELGETAADITDRLLEHSASELEDSLSTWNESSRIGQPAIQGSDFALIPCGLDALVDIAPDFLIDAGFESVARAA
ncbi:hypothetical protein [Candidatus Poriferisodalis sp.]|uniref:hypothetical protein n=1 Tax=Candidatus Poriferisodalis sp. TaxID=3101277 RepID=UPI003AF480F1